MKILTNSPCIAGRLARHRTQEKGTRARKMEKTSVCKELRARAKAQMEVDDAMDLDACEDESEEYWDAITGMKLDSKLVRMAQAEEVQYYRSMKVYTKVDRSVAFSKTGRAPIKVRWVDHNKGTDEEPMIRSRLVAKEIKVCDKPELLTATPPLEAVKMVISFAAEKGPTDKCLMHNDVSRAYFHAKARRDVFVKTAREDWDEGDDGKCGWLNLSMYGTRDAASNWEASNWEAKYMEELTALGFARGRSNPCVFRHYERDIDTVVHGDDYFSCGSAESLMWMQRGLEKLFALKTKVIGKRLGMVKELVVLGRPVWFEDQGIT